jgi:hypothetical protein
MPPPLKLLLVVPQCRGMAMRSAALTLNPARLPQPMVNTQRRSSLRRTFE